MLVLLVAVPALGVLGQTTQIPLGTPNTTVIWKTETIVTQISVHGVVSPPATNIITISSSTSTTVAHISTPTQADLPSTYPTSVPSITTQIVTETKIVTESAPLSATTSPVFIPPDAPRKIWSAPLQMSDLSAFNISAFSGGHNNLNIVKGIPAHASATSVAAASTNRPISWDNSSSVLQLLYPAHSINPAKRPQGGAQFYASPLDITGAKNITLQYSVFFPADFDWVLGGKLPGIYGGRTGCSGGDSALNCFSTRLMWRRGGAGELYLYAPKDKQSEALCSHPQSVCDTAYGFSIGRGSFKWARGAWTTVQQLIVLNTPGKRDGCFTLNVNGQTAIERRDIYYRGVLDTAGHKHKSGNGGLLDLGPLLGGLGILGQGQVSFEDDTEASPPADISVPTYQLQQGGAVELGDAEMTVPVSVGLNAEVSAESTSGRSKDTVKKVIVQTPQPTGQVLAKPVGFIGLFFSTFFGGHDLKYATPRDQYVWFKDFAISHNE